MMCKTAGRIVEYDSLTLHGNLHLVSTLKLFDNERRRDLLLFTPSPEDESGETSIPTKRVEHCGKFSGSDDRWMKFSKESKIK